MTPLTSAEATRRALTKIAKTAAAYAECALQDGADNATQIANSVEYEMLRDKELAAAIDLAVLAARVEQMQWVLDQSPRYHDEELIEERDRLRREMEGKG